MVVKAKIRTMRNNADRNMSIYDSDSYRLVTSLKILGCGHN